MKWFKENYYWVFAIFCILVSVGIVWMAKENGDIKAWATKPLSKATIGDASGLLLLGAIYGAIFRK